MRFCGFTAFPSWNLRQIGPEVQLVIFGHPSKQKDRQTNRHYYFIYKDLWLLTTFAKEAANMIFSDSFWECAAIWTIHANQYSFSRSK